METDWVILYWYTFWVSTRCKLTCVFLLRLKHLILKCPNHLQFLHWFLVVGQLNPGLCLVSPNLEQLGSSLLWNLIPAHSYLNCFVLTDLDQLVIGNYGIAAFYFFLLFVLSNQHWPLTSTFWDIPGLTNQTKIYLYTGGFKFLEGMLTAYCFCIWLYYLSTLNLA